jgi:hypothetical protein
MWTETWGIGMGFELTIYLVGPVMNLPIYLAGTASFALYLLVLG